MNAGRPRRCVPHGPDIRGRMCLSPPGQARRHTPWTLAGQDGMSPRTGPDIRGPECACPRRDRHAAVHAMDAGRPRRYVSLHGTRHPRQSVPVPAGTGTPPSRHERWPAKTVCLPARDPTSAAECAVPAGTGTPPDAMDAGRPRRYVSPHGTRHPRQSVPVPAGTGTPPDAMDAGRPRRYVSPHGTRHPRQGVPVLAGTGTPPDAMDAGRPRRYVSPHGTRHPRQGVLARFFG